MCEYTSVKTPIPEPSKLFYMSADNKGNTECVVLENVSIFHRINSCAIIEKTTSNIENNNFISSQ